jgi:hypothetical protein
VKKDEVRGGGMERTGGEDCKGGRESRGVKIEGERHVKYKRREVGQGTSSVES